jgi:hypothetical protein
VVVKYWARAKGASHSFIGKTCPREQAGGSFHPERILLITGTRKKRGRDARLMQDAAVEIKSDHKKEKLRKNFFQL